MTITIVIVTIVSVAVGVMCWLFNTMDRKKGG
jgi:hypothetical protein